MVNAERLSSNQIRARAHQMVIRPMLNAVGIDTLLKRGWLFEDVFETVIQPRFGIGLVEHCDLSSRYALGLYDPIENVAFIDGCLSDWMNDPRRVFTLYHEVCGHGVLQGEWLRQQLRCHQNAHSPCVEPYSQATQTVLERQANIFAAECAAPQPLVDRQLVLRLRPKFPLRYVGSRTYHFGDSGQTRKRHVQDFRDYCRELATFIKPWFGGLSVQALGFQVERSTVVERWPNQSYSLRRVS